MVNTAQPDDVREGQLGATCDGDPVWDWHNPEYVPAGSPLNAILERRRVPEWLRRAPVVRALALAIAAQRRVVITGASGRATRLLLLLLAIFPPRSPSLVLLQFIPRLPSADRSPSRPGGMLKRWYLTLVQRRVVQRSLLRAHTLTAWETTAYAAYFEVPGSLFTHIPWPLVSDVDSLPPYGDRAGVFMSGRAACDWECAFAAAQGQGWDLTVVCSQADLERVEKLNAGGLATVLTEISAPEHAELVRRAGVYLLALREDEVSSGHIRAANAITSGTPLVASAVRGVSEYLADGVNALTFPAGEAQAARSLVNRLLGDRELAESLRSEAFRAAKQHSTVEFYESMHAMIRSAAAEFAISSRRLG